MGAHHEITGAQGVHGGANHGGAQKIAQNPGVQNPLIPHDPGVQDIPAPLATPPS